MEAEKEREKGGKRVKEEKERSTFENDFRTERAALQHNKMSRLRRAFSDSEPSLLRLNAIIKTRNLQTQNIQYVQRRF